ncbi:MAG: hypothetical protein IKC95_07120 [Oscillospiraceae bacterium]|nr:hypothetical protein [Oscillospiraceae bacterium]
MAYRIRYGQALIKKHIIFENQIQFSKKLIPPLICFLVLCGGIVIAKSKAVQDFFLPGNPDVTRSAISGFVTDLKDGEPMKEAITTFCREIIDNAAYPK